MAKVMTQRVLEWEMEEDIEALLEMWAEEP